MVWLLGTNRKQESSHLPKSCETVPVQLVDATPSELEALITGGIYDRGETERALWAEDSFHRLARFINTTL
jgi:hypothetical protein